MSAGDSGTLMPKAARSYNAHYKLFPDARPGTGLATLSHSALTCKEIPLCTNLQVQAFRIGLNRPITFCNVYIHPQEALADNDLVNLNNQLPPPVVTAGDFNAHSPLWENEDVNRDLPKRKKCRILRNIF